MPQTHIGKSKTLDTGRMAPSDQESTSGRNGQEDEGLFHHLISSGCWRLLPLITFTVSSKFESSGGSCMGIGSNFRD